MSSEAGDDIIAARRGRWHRQGIFGEPVEFEGMRTYPRSDIDWDMTDDLGRTNRQRAQSGLAPLGADGKPIPLHHIGQQPGVVAEVTASTHRAGYSILHQNTGQYPSRIDRLGFEQWKGRYWRWRGNHQAE